ncbi:MAG: WcaF family extracellular polysaccharide biosynthesis acetyltransferase [Cyanobacteriota bacterium]|nr:WcaF family extracellular polysaccharide biosynthesis acetyltransferase [Cyanobacteriota bacterium]
MRLDQYTIGTYTPGTSIIQQLLWFFLGDPLVRSRWFVMSGFKVWVLRRFGAEIGKGVRIKPGVRIKFPWRLSVGDHVWIGENAWIDNLAPVTLESHVCLSQDVYLCTGNHDWRDPNFKLMTAEIYIEQSSWIAARAVIGPGVRVSQGAILGLGSVTGSSLDAMTIYAGNPAQPIKKRVLQDSISS